MSKHEKLVEEIKSVIKDWDQIDLSKLSVDDLADRHDLVDVCVELVKLSHSDVRLGRRHI